MTKGCHQPFFSVVIPTYDRAAFVGKAVQSVIGQALDDWELIIVDDASTDHAQGVLRRYVDRRIRVLCNATNME